jgi:transcriptional antiterminator NusG
MSDDDTDLSDVVFDKDLLLPRWFAIQTLSNQELKVKSAIEILVRDQHLESVIDQVLVPSEKVTEVKNGKRNTRVRKFYPGYVFIRLKAYNDDGSFASDLFSKIRSVNGAVRFVGDGEPVELKQSEIDDILLKVSSAVGKVVQKTIYEIGDVVKINDGPFLNLTGAVEALDTDQGRLRVNVSMFGRSTPVDLEFWQVKRYVDGAD